MAKSFKLVKSILASQIEIVIYQILRFMQSKNVIKDKKQLIDALLALFFLK